MLKHLKWYQREDLDEPVVQRMIQVAERRCDGLPEIALLMAKTGKGEFTELIGVSAYLQGIEDGVSMVCTRREGMYEEER